MLGLHSKQKRLGICIAVEKHKCEGHLYIQPPTTWTASTKLPVDANAVQTPVCEVYTVAPEQTTYPGPLATLKHWGLIVQRFGSIQECHVNDV